MAQVPHQRLAALEQRVHALVLGVVVMIPLFAVTFFLRSAIDDIIELALLRKLRALVEGAAQVRAEL